MRRKGWNFTWMMAPLLAVFLTGCCDDENVLGVREGGGGGPAAVPLGTASTFVVLGGSTVTNTGATAVTGDLGVSPGTAVTGFPPGTVSGATHAGDAAAAQAQSDLTVAYNDAAGRTTGVVAVSGDLTGLTLAPGLYKSTSSLAITGALTLNALGDPNATFIIQMASTLTTGPGSQITLIGGAKSSNVIWQVGTSATLGTNSLFQGTILADQSITLNSGAQLNGRALARIGAVTLDTNAIAAP
ncbi:MAG TPA: ice-binding family protein [Candidatus Eisenbacteria bacterium]|nr:ice-binding family protein [Candidatus Eisenbacteria bacterium]